MNDNIVKKNSVKAWFLAARPKTLSAAAVPVMVATAMAWVDGNGVGEWSLASSANGFNYLAAVLCFLFAFVMQIDANFVNDYFDCVRGNDDETRLGPKRACAQGWISLSAMRKALIVTTLLGCAVGLPLAFIGGWEMIMVGIACVVFCFLYTTCLSYWGMGDLLVLVFFGLVPVCCTYYVETQAFPPLAVWLNSLAVGLVIDTLLIVNNYRDIDNDTKAGKRTLAVFVGRKAMGVIYLLVGIAAVVIAAWDVLSNPFNTMMFVWIIFHLSTWRAMVTIGQGKELNKVLGMTARNIFLFGILLSLDIILA